MFASGPGNKPNPRPSEQSSYEPAPKSNKIVGKATQSVDEVESSTSSESVTTGATTEAKPHHRRSASTTEPATSRESAQNHDEMERGPLSETERLSRAADSFDTAAAVSGAVTLASLGTALALGVSLPQMQFAAIGVCFGVIAAKAMREIDLVPALFTGGIGAACITHALEIGLAWGGFSLVASAVGGVLSTVFCSKEASLTRRELSRRRGY